MATQTWTNYLASAVTMTPFFYNKRGEASAFNQTSTVTAATSIIWKLEMALNNINDGDGEGTGREFRAFLARLKGGENLVNIYDLSRATMRGTGTTSTCNIDVAAALGSETITLRNLVANQAAAFKADDAIGIAGNLYIVTNSVASDGLGKATVNILPKLRIPVAVGDIVDADKPTGRFRLDSGYEDTFSIGFESGEGILMFTEVPFT